MKLYMFLEKNSNIGFLVSEGKKGQFWAAQH